MLTMQTDEFLDAVKKNESPRIRQLLSQLKTLVDHDVSLVRSYSPDGFTALALASYLGQKESAEYLLDKGADLDASAKNETGYTALTGAVSQNHNEVAKLLLKKGANVNHQYEGGFTPLMHAAFAGNVELVNLLRFGSISPPDCSILLHYIAETASADGWCCLGLIASASGSCEVCWCSQHWKLRRSLA
ncbi:ankyrin repeat domain-containing protein [Candidatus Bathyarchaeota archaeon]|nr:MAG: ankyrin repeat domain-containing protein [Candidatus Bathyarchaeota archaeon]